MTKLAVRAALPGCINACMHAMHEVAFLCCAHLTALQKNHLITADMMMKGLTLHPPANLTCCFSARLPYMHARCPAWLFCSRRVVSVFHAQWHKLTA